MGALIGLGELEVSPSEFVISRQKFRKNAGVNGLKDNPPLIL